MAASSSRAAEPSRGASAGRSRSAFSRNARSAAPQRFVLTQLFAALHCRDATFRRTHMGNDEEESHSAANDCPHGETKRAAIHLPKERSAATISGVLQTAHISGGRTRPPVLRGSSDHERPWRRRPPRAPCTISRRRRNHGCTKRNSRGSACFPNARNGWAGLSSGTHLTNGHPSTWDSSNAA